MLREGSGILRSAPAPHSGHTLHGLSSASESLCPSHGDRVTRDKPLASLRATPPSLRTSAKVLLPNELPLVAVAVGFLPDLFWGTSQRKAPVPVLPSWDLVTTRTHEASSASTPPSPAQRSSHTAPVTRDRRAPVQKRCLRTQHGWLLSVLVHAVGPTTSR